MICFDLELKEKNKDLENILSFCEEGGRLSTLFSEVKEKFAGNLVDESPESEPFLYMKVVPVRTGDSIVGASIVPTACFEVGVKEELIEFISKKK